MSVPIRVVLAALVGGIITFFWGAVAHIALPLGEMGMSTVAENEEKPLQEALARSLGHEGLFIVPGGPMREEMNEEARLAWEKAHADDPTAFIVYRPRMGAMMPPSLLMNEAMSNVLAAGLAAVILALSATGFAGRVAICVLIGVTGWLSISFSYWNWYTFPADFSLAELAMQAIGWLVSGVPMALLVRGRVAVTSPA